MLSPLARLTTLGLIIASAVFAALAAHAPAQVGKDRVPWTTSKIQGSPEPPLPYRLERVFPKLSFQKMTHMATLPGTTRLFVTTQAGRIYSFMPDDKVEKADLFLNMPQDVKSCQPSKTVKGVDSLYCMAFHPKFAENRHVYILYLVDGTQPLETTRLRNRERVSRFTVRKTDPPTADPDSEKIIMEWATEKGGHNGGTVCFGPDGYLYISMGDGGPPTPPDLYMTGQDLSDFMSSILRIDVDKTDGDKPYRVPPDNPFVNLKDARPEIWAYGVRNPWKINFDRASGDLWCGDVGWEMWEMFYRIRKGSNHGWSIMEGPQAVHINAKRGPTPIVPPEVYFHHAEASSATGGFVYHGKKLPDLAGTYICGDYISGKIWSMRFDNQRVLSVKEIVQSRTRIVGFGQDNDNELYVLAYSDIAEGIYRLAPKVALAKDAAAKFPRKLSETGLFASATELAPAPGVYPYDIIAQPWQDHATAQRVVALPGLSSASIYPDAIKVSSTAFYKSRIFFPKDGVLAKTISIEMERDKPASQRRLETQILHFDGSDWFGYTYRWNDAQTDADLVPAGGADVQLDIVDAEAPGGRRQQTWHFPSRTQCLICHNVWAGPPLGFIPEQLSRGGQLQQLQSLKIATPAAEGKFRPLFTLADPHDAKQTLTNRARSYLDVNCAHCHQSGAGGGTTIDLRAQIALNAAKAVDATPYQGTFDLPDGRLLASGDPLRSVLYYRIAKTGSGRMPHIGSDLVDVRGVEVIHDWIRSLPAKATGAKANPHQAEQAALDALIASKSKDAAKDPNVERLLSTTSGALLLTRALDTNLLPAELRQPIAAVAVARPAVRDLFERFLPAENRVKRLGTLIQPETILNLKGNPDQGRKVFFETVGVQCAVCHKIGGMGGPAGPDLSEIGKKLDRAKLLESILEPSKDIDPAYTSYAVHLKDGRVVVGLIASRNDKEIVLRDAQAKEQRIAAEDVEAVTPQRQSLMPDQLLRDITAQQAVDLLDFLASLKGSK